MVGAVDASFVARTFASASTQGVSSRPKSASKQTTPEETQKLNELKARDREVREHEQAHISAGGALIRGGASYKYETGPDGKQYAIGGDVSIDVSPGRNAADTIRRAEQIREAALAPKEPSAQDYSVAAQASGMQAKAQAEASKSGQDSPAGQGGSASPPNAASATAVRAYQIAQDAFTSIAGSLIAARA
ncbi:hypothetical protein GCM10025771_33410 [Niveibacterium umoris]|uniref:Catalase n=1 Tax=Niveibacterium umoris TaxID=1193620 RepID=A0A840BKQ4_9RHOO|nr:putative metalloprotease CJM1_0395 family protein [Niveibacterium umoris]MBB4011466.1 hypothetical protein [Niveibacterium umoris]